MTSTAAMLVETVRLKGQGFRVVRQATVIVTSAFSANFSKSRNSIIRSKTPSSGFMTTVGEASAGGVQPNTAGETLISSIRIASDVLDAKLHRIVARMKVSDRLCADHALVDQHEADATPHTDPATRKNSIIAASERRFHPARQCRATVKQSPRRARRISGNPTLQMLHVEDAFDHLPGFFVDGLAGLAGPVLHLHEEAAFLPDAPAV